MSHNLNKISSKLLGLYQLKKPLTLHC